MPTPREELDRLRKLKRLKELEAKANSSQGLSLSDIDPMKDIKLFGVSSDDIVGAGDLALNVATGAAAKPVAGGIAVKDVLQGEGLKGAETVEKFTNEIQTDLDPSGQRLAAKIGGAIESLADEPAFSGILDQLKKAQEGLKFVGEKTGEMIADPFGVTGDSERVKTARNVGAALSEAIPQTALEVAGFKGASQAKNLPKVSKITQEVRFPKAPPKEAVSDDALKKIAETVKKGTEKDLAKLVDSDPDFFRAAAELGVKTDPLASFSSKNPQFVAVESGLASVPSSALDVQTKAFITDLSKRADGIIEGFGGTLDKSQMNLDFAAKNLKVVEDLAVKADEVYGSIAKVLPRSKRFEAPKTVSFVRGVAKEMGGVKELPPKLRKILNELTPVVKTTKGKTIVNAATGIPKTFGASQEVINPTLGKIDQLRREIGQAINKKSGAFKDTESGLLKALYSRLSQDQDAIAESAGFGEIAKSAKALISKRKLLEDNMTTLLGRDLNKALSVGVSGAVKGLAKGEIGKFNSIVNAIPKAQRKEVIVTVLNDVFKGSGVGSQSLNPTQYVKWFESVNRSSAAKAALFKELPAGAPKALENLFKVSKGVSKALGDRVATGRLNAMFNEDTGFLRRMIGRAVPSVVAAATGSPTASLMTNSTMDFIKQSSQGAKKASDLLGSFQFQDLVRRAAREGTLEGIEKSKGLKGAEQAIKKTKAHKRWVKTLNEDQLSELRRLGIINYLFLKDIDSSESKKDE